MTTRLVLNTKPVMQQTELNRCTTTYYYYCYCYYYYYY